MSISSAIVTKLSASIAKCLLKYYLGNASAVALPAVGLDAEFAEGLGEQLGEDLADLAKEKIGDELTQRATIRQFEDLADQIVAKVKSAFEKATNRTLDFDSIGTQLARTLNGRVTATFVVENDFDFDRLAAAFRTARPLTPGALNSEETELYDLSLDQAIRYILETVSKLPKFEQAVAGESLKRLRSLTDTLPESLELTRTILEEVRGTSKLNKFEIDYRLSLTRNLDQIELFGVDLQGSNRYQPLTVAYYTLEAQVSADSLRQEAKPHPSHSRVDDEEARIDGISDEMDERQNFSVEALLAKFFSERKHLLIRGPAGSGKTTLLQWIAVRAASKTFKDPLSDCNSRLPFYIRLRQFSDRGLPRPEQFLDASAPNLTGGMPAGWVHDQLSNSECFILIDGIDEISGSKRRELTSWINQLTHDFSSARIIASSRHHALEDKTWSLPGNFAEVDLCEMKQEDIDSFINKWHEAVSVNVQAEADKAELLRLAESIKRQLRESHQLRNLSTNPLLCALMCALHRDRRGTLPSDRIQLYEACCEMLMERRDQERGVMLSDYPALEYRRHKRSLIQAFAYWMMVCGLTEVEQERADEYFDKRLGNLTSVPRTTGSKVRRLFVDRTGMLREPVHRRIDFTHRSFQEYLAAHAVVDEDEIDFVINHADDDQWWEVLVLIAGLANRKSRERLLSVA